MFTVWYGMMCVLPVREEACACRESTGHAGLRAAHSLGSDTPRIRGNCCPSSKGLGTPIENQLASRSGPTALCISSGGRPARSGPASGWRRFCSPVLDLPLECQRVNNAGEPSWHTLGVSRPGASLGEQADWVRRPRAHGRARGRFPPRLSTEPGIVPWGRTGAFRSGDREVGSQGPVSPPSTRPRSYYGRGENWALRFFRLFSHYVLNGCHFLKFGRLLN